LINTNEILNKYNLRLTKSLGQNFLTDANIIRKITEAGQLSKEDLVVEVGPGIGALTVSLAEHAGKVIAVEVDKNLLPALRETTGHLENVTVVYGDILKTDIKHIIGQWHGPIKIISNLPYYITTPVIMMFLENDIPVDRMVVMVQREVAQRMTAKPGTRDYSALSVAVQAAGTPKILFHVSRNCFIPKPEVDSTVLSITLDRHYISLIKDSKTFNHCVRAAFSQRRKTLLNALSTSPCLGLNKETARQVISEMQLKDTVRGEELSVEQFIQMSNLIKSISNKSS
jgi:16S rRNA (adenine1518-N6/adenine1519-N6)-dimethyltransferase